MDKITGLDFKIKEMAARIRELREIEGYTTDEMALKTGVAESEYIACENGEIYVKESTCTDKVCMRSGRISKSGEGIICAPNRVSIEIDGKSDLPDAMTG